MEDDALAAAARDTFYANCKRDAEAFLAGTMTPWEFAGSVWFEAGTAAPNWDESRARWLDEWVRFAHLDDELDEVSLGRAPEGQLERVIAQLEQEARRLLES